ncbi:MAG: efflux RND transporter periplasmic adaptor subunit [Cyanobacteria bacterium SZAS-4]|nr:efflux RND transporter periplasmic adaptor subunit [Cyanobacteria bacterium SZAS-4]
MKKEFSESLTSAAIQVIGDHSAKGSADQLPEVTGGSEPNALQPSNNHPVLQIDTKSKLSPKSTLAVVSAVILMVAGMVGTYLYNNKPWQQHAAVKTAPPAVTVTTALAERRMIDDDLIVTGSVSAWDPMSVGSEVGGLRIKTVNVEEGDRVKKGQVLVTLNSALLQTQLAQAKARLASNQANLKKSIQPNRSEDIRAMQAALAQAEANTAQEQAHAAQAKVNLKDANVNASRYRTLARMGANSAQDAEAKQLAAETAKEEVASSAAKIKAAQFMEAQAREKLLAATHGGRNEDIAISRAAIAETTAQINQLAEQIAETVIVAPDDGLISKREAHIGDITTAGTPLFSIIRLNKLELRAQVSDLDLVKFKPGQVVTVSATEEESKPIEAFVNLVSPQVDPQTRLGTVRISLPSNAGLKPGMFARADVRFGRRSAITVPVASVITRNGQASVFTLEGDRVSNCPVKVGNQTDKYAEILSGLADKQTVVVQGARFLSDRDIVRVSQ